MSTLPWQVLLIGGASGVGKTSISYRLAQHYRIGITEVDDFQVILERMTSPEQYPVLHFWRMHPEEARRMDEDQQLDVMLRYSAVVSDALELVIANHIESRTPIVLEGDFILPALAALPSYAGVAADGLVRALFVYEQDEDQIADNYQRREGKRQPKRARGSWRHSEWLREEAARLGVPVLPARPWDTTFARALALLGEEYGS
ncbi:MAG TPA: hypothetical protein VFS21_16420 [Roseiflexaceae bacterium]|nr:hypothetical protein [Roseiflexaceae bacterium]